MYWYLEAIRLNPKSWHQKQKEKKTDLTLKKLIEKVLEDLSFYGYKRVARELKRRGRSFNHKRIYRVMKKHNLLKKPKKNKPFTTNSNHNLKRHPNLIKDIIPSFPDHIWAADITYIRLQKGFCYLAAIIDVFTKNIRGWSLKKTLETELPLEALKRALQKQKPIFHHSDQGIQYCSKEYANKLKENKIKISMSDKGQPTQNPFIESFFRSLKVEEVYMFDYQTIEEAKASIKNFVNIVYTKKRLHSSLGYLPPKEFEDAWRKQNSRLLKVSDPIIEKNSLLAVS